MFLARRVRPDVIHTWLTYMDILGGLSAKLLRIPWVMSERSGAEMYRPAVLNRLRAALGRHAHLIAANSTGGAGYWTDLGVPPVRVVVIPNFVPLGEFDSAPILQDPRISEDEELVLHVGRLSSEKNPQLVIAAFREVCRERPRAKLAFCGEGPLLDRLKAQVHEAGLDERVIFAGFVPRVASWIKRAGVVVAVSTFEGHPNAALEAMAARVPLVVSNIPSYRAILDDCSASFVSPNEPRAIAAAIVDALQDRNRQASDRAARARLTVEHLSLDSMVQQYEGLYQRVVEIAGSTLSALGTVRPAPDGRRR
jgi:glycosyltransferase involved in cell wall biosynthesis